MWLLQWYYYNQDVISLLLYYYIVIYYIVMSLISYTIIINQNANIQSDACSSHWSRVGVVFPLHNQSLDRYLRVGVDGYVFWTQMDTFMKV